MTAVNSIQMLLRNLDSDITQLHAPSSPLAAHELLVLVFFFWIKCLFYMELLYLVIKKHISVSCGPRQAQTVRGTVYCFIAFPLALPKHTHTHAW